MIESLLIMCASLGSVPELQNKQVKTKDKDSSRGSVWFFLSWLLFSIYGIAYCTSSIHKVEKSRVDKSHVAIWKDSSLYSPYKFSMKGAIFVDLGPRCLHMDYLNNGQQWGMLHEYFCGQETEEKCLH